MTDNSDALRRARRRDSLDKRRRAAETLEAMVNTGETISFPAVARRAAVSVWLLYADHDLAGRISDARDRQRQAGADRAWRLPARSLLTEQSLRADLANSREQSRQLGQEVAVLRDRVAHQLGEAADIARGRLTNPLVGQLEDRATELETENHALRRRLAEFEAGLAESTATLDAARAMNRELMSELNRSEGQPHGRPPHPKSPRRSAR